ncbi:hypothetical protein GXM_07167 [Nostoc sphaeroides CCNUC1]|uniref:Uncharacterized protein n=1 Tax=Nostoc sphaeroides CCNUC1 TaxID=2653204 RepID=A0A5P8WA53_9NOSO|nr:hypothetical protein GXM_07167 [Nostoc sphaeroides CCNUC1]
MCGDFILLVGMQWAMLRWRNRPPDTVGELIGGLTPHF